MTWKEYVGLLIGLIFLILSSAQTNALELKNDDIIKMSPGDQAPYEGIFMPESYFYYYEGAVAEKESCQKSISNVDTLCLNEPKMDSFEKSAKPYLLGAVTGAAVAAAFNTPRTSDKILILSSALVLNLIFAF